MPGRPRRQCCAAAVASLSLRARGALGAEPYLVPGAPAATGLLAGAELGGRLGGQEALSEAERGHQLDMLLAADELLQLGIERLVEILVFLAEGHPAVPHHRLAGDGAEGDRRFDAVILRSHVGNR